MIYIGNNEISNIYVGTEEIIGIYAGDLQIYPTDFGVVTAISLENLVWVKDVPYSGGTADSGNCSFKVYAYYDSGKRKNVTHGATVSGSLVVPETTANTREMVGTLTLTASYSGFTATGNVTVYQEAATSDFSKEYLTFIVTSGGTIVWRKAGRSAQNLSISYSINNGTWTTITASSTTGAAINVVAGDEVRFKGTNSSYAKSASYVTACRFAGTATCCVCGNIMSLIYGDNFIGQNKLQSANAFCGLFFSYSKMTSDGKHKLVLPATTLTNDCYHHMFYGCSNLTTAPELPAPTLKSLCYAEMFGGCSKLNYIKCLATNISADRCTLYWHNGVSSTGTFVKASSMETWTTGNKGIPEGWTVVNNS